MATDFNVQLGTLGEWVSGIGALLAVGVALWVVWGDRRGARRRFVRDIQVDEPAFYDRAFGEDRWKVSVSNRTREDLYNVDVVVRSDGVDYRAERRLRLPHEDAYQPVVEIPGALESDAGTDSAPRVRVALVGLDNLVMTRDFDGRWSFRRGSRSRESG